MIRKHKFVYIMALLRPFSFTYTINGQDNHNVPG
jgi:hypothetical protein